LVQWRPIRPNAPAALISTSGYFKAFKGEGLISRIEQPVGYNIQRIKGDPFTLIGGGRQVIAFSDSGRAVRLPMTLLGQASEGRLMHTDRLIAAYAVESSAQFLLAADDGTIQHVRASSIPLSDDLNTTGTKLFPKRDLQTVVLWRNDCPLWIVTDQRIIAQEIAGTPSGKISLNKGESLVTLITH
jgi:hypothetical protein